jgi:hypothetical protein
MLFALGDEIGSQLRHLFLLSRVDLGGASPLRLVLGAFPLGLFLRSAR